ncbi:MAG: DUF58 domain-containing protein [Candidatus ainarchaeum sp.]|nr:DUF58 domain-containing protein [Candidatus ainarchaeum sp.]
MISFRGISLLTAGIAVSLASLPLSNPFLAILGASVISFTAASAYNFSRLAGKARVSVERETSPKKLPEGETASCTLEIKTGTSLSCTAEDNVPPFFKTSGGTRASFQGSGTLSYSFSSPTRGLFSIGPAKVTASDPAGLFRAELVSGVTQQVLFYPSLAEVKKYDLQMRRRSFHHSSGIRKAIAQGAGTEFVALRKYAAGDEFRQIDWKATARSRQLIVRTFEAERRQRVVIALDAGRLMHSGKTVSMLDAGINAAVLLSHVVLKRGDLLGFAAFSSRLDCFVKPGNSRAQFYAILDALGRITPSEETDFAESFRKLTAALTKRSLIIVISSLQGEDAKRMAEAVKLLKAHRHAIVIIAPFEPWFEPLPEKDPLSRFIAESAEEKYRKDLDLVTSAVKRFGACVIPVGPESAGPSTLQRYAYAVNKGLASI